MTLYLDISKPFEVYNPPFEEIQNVSNLFSQRFTATGFYDSQKNIIYFFGGVNATEENVKILRSYNLTTNEWDIPKTIGIEPKNTIGPNGVNKNGKVYICGGIHSDGIEMNIFDIISLTWSKGSTSTLNVSLTQTTSTLLSNGKIVFIGNISDTNQVANMNQIPIYDAISDSWSWMITQGDSVENRSGHSAILTPDERIIIFGGQGNNRTEVDKEQQLAVLETNEDPYKWFIIPIIPGISTPQTLSFHSATLVGNYMLINFGIAVLGDDTSNTHILDIRNFTWVTQFEPEVSDISPEIPPTSPPNGKKIVIIIGIACGCVSSAITGFLVHKIYKSCNMKRQRNIPHCWIFDQNWN